MDPKISRRDFLNGVSIAIGASLLPGCGKNGEPVANAPNVYYPPAETGMRGSHPGSFEVAHAAVQGQRWTAEQTGEHYDLIVVGAGISGLSAAYIYRRDVDANARILILDNHDDFGGHAKRNEFTLDGRTMIGYGGTMLIEAPGTYPEVSKQVFREIGIDVGRHDEFHLDEEMASLGLGRVNFFDRETFGADHLATGDLATGEGIDELPLSDLGKEELRRLFADKENYLENYAPLERRNMLQSYSWRDYLKTFAGMSEEVLDFVQKMPHGVWAIGADAFPAWVAWSEGYPGFAGMDLGYDHVETEADESRFRFPDGNASVARLLVRKLVPRVAPGDSMEDIVTARFDYSQLDQAENGTRIRLSSTVVDLHHQEGKLDADVDVTYVKDGAGRTVTASKIVWAGYHAMLPYVCPDVPADQAVAQGTSDRAPLVYINVLIRNWTSLVNLGIQRAYFPGGFLQAMLLTHPISIGDYRFPQPDEPVVLHMQHIPLKPGLPAPEQFREGRRALLEMPFETFEQHVRDQLDRLLGPGGFDADRDIAGITVNRWSHGYAYSVDDETGDVAWLPKAWNHENRPWEVARQRVGNIVFAGTDAASNAMTESAIEEAHRAVHSLASKPRA